MRHARKRSERIHGPYRKGNRWRIVHVDAHGNRGKPISFPTEQAALAAIRAAQKAIDAAGTGAGTIDDALVAYVATLRHRPDNGLRPPNPNTARTYEIVLRGLLGPVLSHAPSAITESRARAIWKRYRDLPTPKGQARSVATLIDARARVRSLWRFMIADGAYGVRRNPWECIESPGRPREGKAQLRLHEARKLVADAMPRALRGNGLSARIVIQLYLGLRPGETARIRPRDIDGAQLWVARGKSGRGRIVDIPAALAPIMGMIAAGKLRVDQSGSVYRQALARACDRAGVPRICPQALRGMHATYARESGVAPAAVSAQLGQAPGSYARLAARNYVAPGTDDRVRSMRAADALGAGNLKARSEFPRRRRFGNLARLLAKRARNSA